MVTSFRREFNAYASLSSQVLCCKHCISMYLDECRRKLRLFAKKIGHKLYSKPAKLYGPGFNIQYFPNIFYFARCTKYQALINTQIYSFQMYIILATGSQNLGRLNRKLSEKSQRSSGVCLSVRLCVKYFVWTSPEPLSRLI